MFIQFVEIDVFVELNESSNPQFYLLNAFINIPKSKISTFRLPNSISTVFYFSDFRIPTSAFQTLSSIGQQALDFLHIGFGNQMR